MAVDDKFQIIVVQHVTPASPDVQQLGPAVEKIEQGLGEAPEALVADAGYFSESNVECLEGRGVEAFIATGRQKHGAEVVAVRGRPRRDLTCREKMPRKLKTKRGRTVCALRKSIVEPVFGQIKQARGFRQFLLRGIRKVQGEWALVCTAHNLAKIHTAMRVS